MLDLKLRENLLPHGHNHTVQFYRDDGVLLQELESYIGTALAYGGSAIIIATTRHIESLTQKLHSHGIDATKARTEGRFIALDAASVLAEFMVDGRPDRVQFFATAGRIITGAATASRDKNRHVVAFGEMVALLWAEGQTEAAIELEKFWNELASMYSFALYCAYPMQAFYQQETAASFLRICAEHTCVVGI
jgi:hypothetical protein